MARTEPTTSSRAMLAMKKKVGMAKTFPASRTPRRLAKAIRITRPIEIHTVPGTRAGNTEVRAATPAATDTATVRV